MPMHVCIHSIYVHIYGAHMYKTIVCIFTHACMYMEHPGGSGHTYMCWCQRMMCACSQDRIYIYVPACVHLHPQILDGDSMVGHRSCCVDSE